MISSKVEFFVYRIVSAIDSGKNINISTLKESIENETIFQNLEKIIDIKSDHFSQSEQSMLIDNWKSLNNSYLPEDLGVKKNGLCLLISYIISNISNILSDT